MFYFIKAYKRKKYFLKIPSLVIRHLFFIIKIFISFYQDAEMLSMNDEDLLVTFFTQENRLQLKALFAQYERLTGNPVEKVREREKYQQRAGNNCFCFGTPIEMVLG